MNLTLPRQILWNVSISQDQLDLESDWVLRFINDSYDAASRGFTVQGSGAGGSTTSSISSTVCPTATSS